MAEERDRYDEDLMFSKIEEVAPDQEMSALLSLNQTKQKHLGHMADPRLVDL